MAKAYLKDNANLFFILGMIHRDDEGPQLLHEWLMRIMPDVITLEFSNYGLEFRKGKGDEYKKRVEEALDKMKGNNEQYNRNALSLLFSYIDMPYEYEVASRHAAEQNASLHLIDIDAFSYLKLRKADELFGEDNLKQLLSGDGEPVGGQKAAARLFFEKGIKLFSYDNEMYMRDKYMSDRISILMKNRTNNKFLHICGWQHLQDPYGLFAPFHPVKVFSHDKTLCI